MSRKIESFSRFEKTGTANRNYPEVAAGSRSGGYGRFTEGHINDLHDSLRNVQHIWVQRRLSTQILS